MSNAEQQYGRDRDLRERLNNQRRQEKTRHLSIRSRSRSPENADREAQSSLSPPYDRRRRVRRDSSSSWPNGQTDSSPARSDRSSATSFKRETDPVILARRQKQLDYGKNTLCYQEYSKTVPRHKREPFHPRTPNKMRQTSRRRWDSAIKNWRIHLHYWNDPSFSPPKRETVPVILVARQEQIDNVKKTDCYQEYIKSVPRHRRESFHPKTPTKTRRTSQQLWNYAIANWRALLLFWNDPARLAGLQKNQAGREAIGSQFGATVPVTCAPIPLLTESGQPTSRTDTTPVVEQELSESELSVRELATLAKRQKQLDIGKNTLCYQEYSKAVPSPVKFATELQRRKPDSDVSEFTGAASVTTTTERSLANASQPTQPALSPPPPAKHEPAEPEPSALLQDPFQPIRSADATPIVKQEPAEPEPSALLQDPLQLTCSADTTPTMKHEPPEPESSAPVLEMLLPTCSAGTAPIVKQEKVETEPSALQQEPIQLKVHASERTPWRSGSVMVKTEPVSLVSANEEPGYFAALKREQEDPEPVRIKRERLDPELDIVKREPREEEPEPVLNEVPGHIKREPAYGVNDYYPSFSWADDVEGLAEEFANGSDV